MDRGLKSVELPPRMFLYTIDQVAHVLEVSENRLTRSFIYFYGRSSGRKPLALIGARNIAAEDARPDWRVPENELVRWMRFKGFKFRPLERLQG